jgi:hypothetical protein
MKKIHILLASMLTVAVFLSPAYSIDAGNIEIHGFISQGYLLTDSNNYLAETEDGTFEFNELGINFSTDLTDLLHIGVQLFARDLGTVGNDDVVLDWAYADYRWQDWLGIRAGRIKIDYGLYNETREMDMLRTGVMLPQSVYSELWRDSFSCINGAALYGYIPVSFMGRLAYDLQIGAMTFKKDAGFTRAFAHRMNETLDISSMNSDYAWFADVQWNTPVPNLKTKFTAYDIEGMEADGNITVTMTDGSTVNSAVTYELKEKNGYVASLEYTWKNLILAAEYSEDNYQIEKDMEAQIQAQGNPPEGGVPPTGDGPPKMTSEGWYVSASYRFTDWFETALSYSEYYPNADDKDGEARKDHEHAFMSWLKTTTLSTRFDINDYWVLKLEASYNDGFGGINLADNPDELEPYWSLFAAKMTFSF